MSERNLVKFAFTFRCFTTLVVAITLICLQSGCSKLSQGTFNRDILGGKKFPPRWSRDHDSADRYFTDPNAGHDSTSKKGEARIVGVDEGEASDIDVKLVASPPPETDPDCEHFSGCDCHKPKEKPKLPYAEPIDPPPVSALELAKMEVPAGIVHQPLTPILFDNQTRQVQDVGNSSNTLRQAKDWSHEKSAEVIQKPAAIELAKYESNPVRFNPSKHQSSSRISELDLIRSPNPSEPATRDIEKVETMATQSCANCRDKKCSGNCGERRIASAKLRPVVDSDPIVIVATTSSDTIPPFADAPSGDDQVNFSAPAPTIENMEVANVPTTDSFDDLSDDEWVEMFGPMNSEAASCQTCQTGQCEDPACQLPADSAIVATEQAEAATEVPMTNELIAAIQHAETIIGNSLDQTTPESNVVQANSIETMTQPESNNDFQPVAHNSESDGAKVEVEIPSWTQPETSESQPFPVETPADDLPPEPMSSNEFQPIESKSVELKPNLSQPNFSPEQSVRVEIIDKTVPWEMKLTETIENVKSQLANETEPAKCNALEVNLRLLEVLQRQMADVEIKRESLSDEEKQVWQHQLDAITLMLKTGESSETDLKRHSSAIETLAHLRKAVERLESMADLKITNGAFCTEVSGFGQFKTFASTKFANNQKMLIYCEVENYSSMESHVNFQTEVRTRLQGSYVIYDQQGRAVQQAEYPIIEDIARKRRRDFYMHFPIQLQNLGTGTYRLELLVEDLNGNKTASIEPILAFEVK